MALPHQNDAATQRRAQLKRWIDELFAGSQAAFIASTNDGKTQINQGELSGLLKQKSFGEKRARRLEEQAGMPAGYLDSDAAPSDPAAQVTEQPVAQYKVGGAVVIAKPAAQWPFHLVTHARLMELRRSLGAKSGGEVMRELDRYLDVLVTKWEREAAEKKKRTR